jgi:hypothetical protein
MTNFLLLRGIELRYALTMHLFDDGPATVPALIESLASRGFHIDARQSKSVSDALRWEVRRGRAQRLGRGRYGAGWMPRATECRMRKRVLALRARALSLEGGHNDESWKPPAA